MDDGHVLATAGLVVLLVVVCLVPRGHGLVDQGSVDFAVDGCRAGRRGGVQGGRGLGFKLGVALSPKRPPVQAAWE